MTYAVALILIAATLLVLAYPWLKPRMSEYDGSYVKHRPRPASDLEKDLEKEVMLLRRTREQATGTCRECGAKYPKEGRFCPQCGTKL